MLMFSRQFRRTARPQQGDDKCHRCRSSASVSPSPFQFWSAGSLLTANRQHQTETKSDLWSLSAGAPPLIFVQSQILFWQLLNISKAKLRRCQYNVALDNNPSAGYTRPVNNRRPMERFTLCDSPPSPKKESWTIDCLTRLYRLVFPPRLWAGSVWQLRDDSVFLPFPLIGTSSEIFYFPSRTTWLKWVWALYIKRE